MEREKDLADLRSDAREALSPCDLHEVPLDGDRGRRALCFCRLDTDDLGRDLRLDLC